MNTRRNTSHALGLLAAGICGLATPAQASPNVAIDSAIFVEHRQSDTLHLIATTSDLNRGDKVVTIVRWYRLGGDGSFVITNPLPRTISYQKSSRPEETVSVDGGKTWGRLGTLRVGSRLASPEDVTHIRWRISASHSARGNGQIAYSGIVR